MWRSDLASKAAAAMQASGCEQQTDPCSHQQLRTDLDCVEVRALFAVTCTHKPALLSAEYSSCQLAVLQDMLACLDDRSTRNKALYPLHGAICTFLVVNADQMGCGSWSELQSRLRLERQRGIVKPGLDALDRTLQQEGLDMAT